MSDLAGRKEIRRNDGGRASLTSRAAAALAITSSIGLILVTLLARGARRHWAFDLLAHFPVQIAPGGLTLLVILVALRRWRWSALPLLVAIANAAQVLPVYLPPQQNPGRGGVYRAVSANVHTANEDSTRFLAFIEATKPDFFLVMEMDEDWRGRLRPLEGDYPYSVVRPRPDNFGIGLYSRVPFNSYEIIESTSADLPTIIATMNLGGRPVAVVGTHPLPPVGRRNSQLRNLQLAELGELAARLPGPKLLLGDLNVTSWSPHFSDLLERSKMRDGRQGFGVQPTWPAAPWLLRIPIDHTLVSDDVRVVARRIGPNIGSDHLPVVMDFQIGE